MSGAATSKTPGLIRCAIYTRKSSEEGLEQEFNSLDAQRESGEAYIRSQTGEGWTCLPDRYDDGGFTGGNMDRPALKRLMDDIEAGKIDCVLVYKVDRLSRSLLDFARIMEVFDRKKVSFVSVTQQFNTTHSMGRLTLNILLSFAQFEREIISERTRDKIAATRKKGKWFGGKPILGYDLVGGKLVVNRDEAYQVREMYAIYLDTRSVRLTTAEAVLRGWKTKAWTQKDGTKVGAGVSAGVGGLPLTNAYMHRILTSVSYLGKVQPPAPPNTTPTSARASRRRPSIRRSGRWPRRCSMPTTGALRAMSVLRTPRSTMATPTRTRAKLRPGSERGVPGGGRRRHRFPSYRPEHSRITAQSTSRFPRSLGSSRLLHPRSNAPTSA
jgi:DNA invertase Pin-like site-specific DNA recombinase